MAGEEEERAHSFTFSGNVFAQVVADGFEVGGLEEAFLLGFEKIENRLIE